MPRMAMLYSGLPQYFEQMAWNNVYMFRVHLIIICFIIQCSNLFPQRQMLKSWDFVDPKLALQLSNLNQQLKGLNQQKTAILSNPKLTEDARKKLLRFNQSSIESVSQILEKQKYRMVDYFDEQVNVLTKKSIEISRENQFEVQIQEHRKTASHYSGLNKTKNLDETGIQQNKMSTNLSTTGRITVKVPSFELYPPQQESQRKMGSVVKGKMKKMKKKISLLEGQLKLYREGFMEACELYEEEQRKNIQNEELIELLRKKVAMLENRKTSENKIKEIRQSYERKLGAILKDQEQWEKVRNENKQLLLERNELLKLMKR